MSKDSENLEALENICKLFDGMYSYPMHCCLSAELHMRMQDRGYTVIDQMTAFDLKVVYDLAKARLKRQETLMLNEDGDLIND